jgi:hypothetical protein
VVSVSLIGMRLSSPLLLWIVAALAVIVPVVLIVVWSRPRRDPRPTGATGRHRAVPAAGGRAIGLYANNEYGFCNTWGGVATLVLNSGGHSYSTDGPALPQSLTWLAQVGAL